MEGSTNTSQQIQGLIKCSVHENEEAIVVCLKEDCELERSRLLCLTCLLQEHSMHPSSCVKLQELVNWKSRKTILNWPQDVVAQKIIKQISDEKVKDESEFIEQVFGKFEAEVLQQIKKAKSQVYKIIEKETTLRSQFIEAIQQRIQKITDLSFLTEILFSEGNSESSGVLGSKIIKVNSDTHLANNEQLYESRRIDGVSELENSQNLSQVQSLRESVMNLQETILQQFNDQKLIQTKVLEYDDLNRQLKQQPTTKSIQISKLLRDGQRKKAVTDLKEFFTRNKAKLGSMMQLRNLEEEKSLILSQIEDIPWILLKVFAFEKQKINGANTILAEENTLACFQGSNTCSVALSDLMFQPDDTYGYHVKLQLQRADTQHILIGLIPEQLKDTSNFNNQQFVYTCICCRAQEHNKNMKTIIIKNQKQNGNNVQQQQGLSSLVTIKINQKQNMLDIFDINENLMAQLLADVDLTQISYRFFVASYSSQIQSVRVKLVQAVHLD